MTETEIRNPFFKDQAEGPRKEFSLQEVLQMVLGFSPCYMSKRLAPPMAVCNARIYCGDSMIWKGDCDIYNLRNKIEIVAENFGVVLDLLYESGDRIVWTSKEPAMWNGYCEQTGKGPAPIEACYPLYEQWHRERVNQWMIDHGFKKEPKPRKKKREHSSGHLKRKKVQAKRR